MLSYKQIAMQPSNSQNMYPVKTFTFTSPSLDLLSEDSDRWTDIAEKNRSGQLEVYERLPPNQQPSRKRGVVCLDNRVTKKVPDTEVQQYAAQEQVSEEHKLQVQVGDLVYATNRSFIKSLNDHLEKCESAEGDFYYVSEVAARLKHLQKKGKTDKAQKFRKELESFAKEFGISFEAFNQWQAVMDCKDVRDRFAHPVQRCGIESLQDALSKEVAVLEPCKDAVSAMIVIGQRFNVFTGAASVSI